jgi:hypothetical protein
MSNEETIKEWSEGDPLTHQRLNNIVRPLNRAIKAFSAPKQINSTEPSAAPVAGKNEAFDCTVTESTQTVTDSNGDTIDLERVDSVTCTESSTGRVMTLNITYS